MTWRGAKMKREKKIFKKIRKANFIILNQIPHHALVLNLYNPSVYIFLLILLFCFSFLYCNNKYNDDFIYFYRHEKQCRSGGVHRRSITQCHRHLLEPSGESGKGKFHDIVFDTHTRTRRIHKYIVHI